MAQLENEHNLALLEPTTRHLVIVLIETGLRVGDAVVLPFDPVVDDSVGWPCLRYITGKTRVEQLIPLSIPAASAIEAQQAEVTRRFPDGSPWLFPDPGHNDDGALSYPYRLLLSRLKKWEARIGLHDERGRSVRVTSHQFRHTLGTRLINAGVPQHVVQRVLGHASPEMTGVYAQLHDATVRQAFERYQATRVDITGQVLDFDPAAPTATAEWIKHHLNKIQAALPNGYCGRPPQQDCPHPNACLTCPDFQTTVEFLDIHRRHAESTTVLIAAAEAKGNQRLAANHRRVHDNLTHIIDTLETVAADTDTDTDDEPALTTPATCASPPKPATTRPSNAPTTPSAPSTDTANRSPSPPSPPPPTSHAPGSTANPNCAPSSPTTTRPHPGAIPAAQRATTESNTARTRRPPTRDRTPPRRERHPPRPRRPRTRTTTTPTRTATPATRPRRRHPASTRPHHRPLQVTPAMERLLRAPAAARSASFCVPHH